VQFERRTVASAQARLLRPDSAELGNDRGANPPRPLTEIFATRGVHHPRRRSRDSRRGIYRDFAQPLLRLACDLHRHESFGTEGSETVYAFDSTTRDGCRSLFP
jgi:hypothetical protein